MGILILAALCVLTVILMRHFIAGRSNRPVRNVSQPQVRETAWHHDAEKHLLAGGVKPDSVLSCTYDSGLDGYYEMLLGAYREGRFLRVVMQNDSEDVRLHNDYWRHWDMPWTQLVQVIRRERTTPPARSRIRQPDQTYELAGEYFQARVYSVFRGASFLRLLALDPRSSDEPYRWLRSHIQDAGLRFAEDEQDDPLYGDADDMLQRYVLEVETREEREQHEAASRKALSLSAEERAALKAKCPERIRKHLDSTDYSRDLAKYIDSVRDANGNSLAGVYTNYAKAIVELTMIGAIPSNFYSLFFYENFPQPANYAQVISAEVKAGLRSGMQAVLNWWLREWASSR
jgi:hypothetical protein